MESEIFLTLGCRGSSRTTGVVAAAVLTTGSSPPVCSRRGRRRRGAHDSGTSPTPTPATPQSQSIMRPKLNQRVHHNKKTNYRDLNLTI